MTQKEHHIKFSKNTKGKDFFIGDIHGKFKQLIKELDKKGFNPSQGDRFFSVGDIIDRGKKNLAVIELSRSDWFNLVKGNHEQMIIDRYDLPPYPLAYSMGGRTRYDAIYTHDNNGGKWYSKLKNESARINIYKYFKNLPTAITVETDFGDIGIVHAEVPERFKTWEDLVNNLYSSSIREDAIWNRYAIEDVYNHDIFRMIEKHFRDYSRVIPDVLATIHGHTPVPHTVQINNQFWIDSGMIKREFTILTVDEIVELVNNQGGHAF